MGDTKPDLKVVQPPEEPQEPKAEPQPKAEQPKARKRRKRRGMPQRPKPALGPPKVDESYNDFRSRRTDELKAEGKPTSERAAIIKREWAARPQPAPAPETVSPPPEPPAPSETLAPAPAATAPETDEAPAPKPSKRRRRTGVPRSQAKAEPVKAKARPAKPASARERGEAKGLTLEQLPPEAQAVLARRELARRRRLQQRQEQHQALDRVGRMLLNSADKEGVFLTLEVRPEDQENPFVVRTIDAFDDRGRWAPQELGSPVGGASLSEAVVGAMRQLRALDEADPESD